MTPKTEERLLLDVGAIKANVDQLLEHAKDHGKRISAVERKMWWGSGAIAVLAAVVVPKVRATLGL